MARIGILALQGCIDPHARHLEKLHVDFSFVKTPSELELVDGLILPGGESTTMIKLAKHYDLWEPLRARAGRIPYWGICAGSIIMARQVENPSQDSLGVFDLSVRRNAYGRQMESFQQNVELSQGEEPAVFIRAPKFLSWGKGVSVKGRVQGEPAFLDDGRHMVTAFHPELTESSWFHRIFLERVIQ